MATGNSVDLTLPEVVPARLGSRGRRVLRLTVLFHPDPQRIGEFAELGSLDAGASLELSRAHPLFCSPAGSGSPRPLADLYLSRQAIAVQRNGHGVALKTIAGCSTLQVEDKVVEDCEQIPGVQLDAGIVLTLARRIVLLLHYSSGESPVVGCGLVGESDAIQQVRRQILVAASCDSPVLLLGESGTGKELVAQAIYEHSQHHRSALVTVNMGAIPAELASAELFGVRKGAYTGADADRPGFFRQAHEGTLFLDEVGATAVSVQPGLLRALQSGEIQLAGGGVEQVDVRIISATDASLDAGGSASFSSALRHRLSGIEIRLPPLRQRREDIGMLLWHFYSAAVHNTDRATMLLEQLDDPVVVGQWAMLVAAFSGYHWPGNVRELRNVCQQIAGSSAEAEKFSVPEHVLEMLQGALGRKLNASRAYRPASGLSDTEVRDALSNSDWEMSRAARVLKVSRPALYKRVQMIPDIRVAGDVPVAEVEASYRECEGRLALAADSLRVSRTGLGRRWRAMELEARDF